MRIGIGSDHIGYPMKLNIIEYLQDHQYDIIDYGTDSTERTDYPILGEAVANAVIKQEVECGIVICGTGIGIGIAANKVKGIRACICSEPYSARFSKQHNNTNVLAFGARVIGIEMAKMIVEEWLAAEFEGGRHQKRINMIREIENRK